MFNRVRSYNVLNPGLCDHEDTVHIRYDTLGGPFCPPETEYRATDSSRKLYIAEYSKGTISDWQLIRDKSYFRGNVPINRRVPRLVKPVLHERKRIMGETPKDTCLFSWSKTTGGCETVYARNILSTPLGFVCNKWGNDFIRDNILHDTVIPPTVEGHSFTGVDWYSMQSEFNEQLDQLIPSSFFAGESIYEGQIFIEALKLVLNPPRYVSGLIKNAKRRRLLQVPIRNVWSHYSRILTSAKRRAKTYEIEQLADDLGIPLVGIKDGINADLLYKFGIKPAIHDIGATVHAHSKVNERLQFLNVNRGRYVPIRVRRLSGDTRWTLPAQTNFYEGLTTHLARSRRVNVLFGHGKVRSDINLASGWRAYAEYFGLNKIGGTLWELTPFSFVADWFTNAQERINDLTRIRLGEGPFVNLTAIGHSTKDALSYEAYWLPGWDQSQGMFSDSPSEPTKFLDVEVSRYERYSGIPETSGVVDTSTLGLFHGVTFGELLYQKFL